MAIARALVNNPRLVLADEPTGNLDARNADSIFQLLGELNAAQGTAFLVVTHDLQLAKRMGRQLEMRDGRLNAELTLMGRSNGFTVIVTHRVTLAAVVAGAGWYPLSP